MKFQSIGDKQVIKIIMADFFSLAFIKKVDIQETQTIPIRVNKIKPMLSQVISKLLKISDIKKTLKIFIRKIISQKTFSGKQKLRELIANTNLL